MIGCEPPFRSPRAGGDGGSAGQLDHAGDVPLVPGGLRPWQWHDPRAHSLCKPMAGGPAWEDVVYRTTYDKSNERFIEHLRPTSDISWFRDEMAQLMGQRWKRRKGDGQLDDKVLPRGPAYLITTFWSKDPSRRHREAPLQLPKFQVQNTALWRDLLAALEGRKWHGGKRGMREGEEEGASRRARHRVCSDAIGAEVSRRIVQEMLPWLNMSRVEITASADFETRWRFDRVVGLSYFALVGNEPEESARGSGDDSHNESVNSWFVFKGSEFLHRTRAWRGGGRYAIVLYQSDGPGLPMPEGVEAFALVVRCEGVDGVAQHLTLGATWDEQFARAFVRRIRVYLRSRSPW